MNVVPKCFAIVWCQLFSFPSANRRLTRINICIWRAEIVFFSFRNVLSIDRFVWRSGKQQGTQQNDIKSFGHVHAVWSWVTSISHLWSAVIGDGMQNWCQQMRTHPKFTTNNKYCLMSMNFATHQHNVIRRTFFYESDHLYGLLYGIWCDADANELRKSHATSDFINKINIVCCCPHGLIVVVNVYDPIFGKFPSDHQRWRRRRGKLGCSASEQWTLNE